MKKNVMRISESTLKQMIVEGVKKAMKEEHDWNHYNDGPTQEEEEFEHELYSVIDAYGLHIAEIYGRENFIKWCVEIINNALGK